MGIHQDQSGQRGTIRKVATGLYKSSVSGTYFAHVRINGKLFRDSLETTDRKIADRRLREFRAKKAKVDQRAGKITLGALCDQYGATLDTAATPDAARGPHASAKLSRSSRKAKDAILRRLKDEWPEGEDHSVAAIKPSHCDAWLTKQARRLGRSHFNAYLQLLRALLDFAVRDRIIAENPAAHRKYLKREKPIRLTPSWEEFQAIVADIRAQAFTDHAQDSGDFVEFIGLAGLGQAEASALTWRDVDFERGQLTTFRHKTRTGFVVPIYPQVRQLLERLK
ncbi:MAG: hypothetical protein M3429_06790, partial [Verrucomicrobiota bacterium]|nr:hypothetical protein [Verrucomicrobiota bacterium]